jgi:maltodextrin utilization protein YvdJ
MIALQSLLACPVCFGQSDSPLAWAMNSGILFMLVLIGGVLAAFASFFVHLVKRARLAEAAGSAEAGPHAGLGGTA